MNTPPSKRKAIAVVGTGIMGHAIATNYLRNDYPVYVWNRSADKYQDLVKSGAIACKTPGDATAYADVVFEVTADDNSSKQQWIGGHGIIARANSAQTLITCSTLSAKWVDELAALCAAKGFTFLDMPMTGGRVAAESGNLTLLVGGDESVLASIKLDLLPIAQDVKYFGNSGSGTRYKLILNGLQALHVAGLAEAISAAEKAGLDPSLVGEALCQRPGGVVTDIAWRGYKNWPANITFSVDWIHKDLVYAAALTPGQPRPFLDQTLAKYATAKENGLGSADWTIIMREKV